MHNSANDPALSNLIQVETNLNTMDFGYLSDSNYGCKIERR